MEVFFYNSDTRLFSARTLGLVDSGADHTVIPYSVGLYIGLKVPSEEEKLDSVSGVGGRLGYIERPCKINTINRFRNKVYVFLETVWWIYPDNEMQKELNGLKTEYQSLQNLKSQCIDGTNLSSHFHLKMKETEDSLKKIYSRLETDVLLGRPFFENFEFIQFMHKDRTKESRCYFNYKVLAKKVFEEIKMDDES